MRGNIIGVIKGDTMSLDCSSYRGATDILGNNGKENGNNSEPTVCL